MLYLVAMGLCRRHKFVFIFLVFEMCLSNSGRSSLVEKSFI
jgi:hypothetical protein